MKRTNVILDEQLLEDAVELTGEKTYSAAINRALGDMVRKLKLKRGLEWFVNLEEDPWWPGYAEELFGKEWVERVRERHKKPEPSIIADRAIEKTKNVKTRRRRGTR
ncbi:MAG: type II toxin-antitoxin system VapB family antitoxin [Acidobacteriota bacterium]